MSDTVPAPDNSATFRQVLANVCGEPIVIPCPSWCVIDHAERVNDLTDICHYGPESSVTLPVFIGGDKRVLTAWQVLHPYQPDDEGAGMGRQAVAILPEESDRWCGEVETLNATQLRTFADQLAEHAARLRGMAVRLSAAQRGFMV